MATSPEQQRLQALLCFQHLYSSTVSNAANPGRVSAFNNTERIGNETEAQLIVQAAMSHLQQLQQQQRQQQPALMYNQQYLNLFQPTSVNNVDAEINNNEIDRQPVEKSSQKSQYLQQQDSYHQRLRQSISAQNTALSTPSAASPPMTPVSSSGGVMNTLAPSSSTTVAGGCETPTMRSVYGNDEKPKRRSRLGGTSVKTAAVWQFFTQLPQPEQAATCSLCQKVIKATNSSTTGMIRHLRSCHSAEYVILQEARTLSAFRKNFKNATETEKVKLLQVYGSEFSESLAASITPTTSASNITHLMSSINEAYMRKKNEEELSSSSLSSHHHHHNSQEYHNEKHQQQQKQQYHTVDTIIGGDIVERNAVKCKPSVNFTSQEHKLPFSSSLTQFGGQYLENMMNVIKKSQQMGSSPLPQSAQGTFASSAFEELRTIIVKNQNSVENLQHSLVCQQKEHKNNNNNNDEAVADNNNDINTNNKNNCSNSDSGVVSDQNETDNSDPNTYKDVKHERISLFSSTCSSSMEVADHAHASNAVVTVLSESQTSPKLAVTAETIKSESPLNETTFISPIAPDHSIQNEEEREDDLIKPSPILFPQQYYGESVGRRGLKRPFSGPIQIGGAPIFASTPFDSKHKKQWADETKKLNQQIALMLLIDNEPLSTVERPGFRNFVKMICPTYQMPSSEEFRHEIIPQLSAHLGCNFATFREQLQCNNPMGLPANSPNGLQTVNKSAHSSISAPTTGNNSGDTGRRSGISPSTTIESGFQDFEDVENRSPGSPKCSDNVKTNNNKASIESCNNKNNEQFKELVQNSVLSAQNISQSFRYSIEIDSEKGLLTEQSKTTLPENNKVTKNEIMTADTNERHERNDESAEKADQRNEEIRHDIGGADSSSLSVCSSTDVDTNNNLDAAEAEMNMNGS